MLYIPITEKTLSELPQSENGSEAILRSLSVAELAALFLLLKLPEVSKPPRSNASVLLRAERMIANFIIASDGDGLPALQNSLVDQFNIDQLNLGMKLCSELPVYFLSAEQLAQKEYLKPDGGWNWEFKESVQSDFIDSSILNRYSQYSGRVSKEEERLLHMILSERDEPIDVQGYAGTGKTWLISRLGEALDKSTTLFLADNRVQVKALTTRTPGTKGFTFAQIAEMIFSSDLIGPVRYIRRRYNRRKTLSHSRLATYLQCHEMGSHSREVVAGYAWRAVMNFCSSTDMDIQQKHVNHVFRSSEKWHGQALLALTKRLWSLICIPRDGIELPIRNYHLVKAFALTGHGVPEEYWYKGELIKCTHIIVDEMHNFNPSIQQILQQSSQPIFRFGDYYQALEGLQRPHQLSPTMRKKTMSHSVRAGANVEGIYNDILGKHPIEPESEFSGNKTKITKVNYCSRNEIPDEYCTILTKHAWSMLVIIKKLQEKSASYKIMGSARDDLAWLVRSGISFFTTGTKPNHPEFQYSISWDEFIEKNRRNQPVLLEVDQLMRSGFGFGDLDELLQDAPAYADQAYIIGRVWDSRNAEYEKVRLWDDASGMNRGKNGSPAKLASHVYTGVSRAKNKLFLPQKMLDWFEEF